MSVVLKCCKCGLILSSEYDWLKGYSVARSIVCDTCLNIDRNAANKARSLKQQLDSGLLAKKADIRNLNASNQNLKGQI